MLELNHQSYLYPFMVLVEIIKCPMHGIVQPVRAMQERGRVNEEQVRGGRYSRLREEGDSDLPVLPHCI